MGLRKTREGGQSGSQRLQSPLVRASPHLPECPSKEDTTTVSSPREVEGVTQGHTAQGKQVRRDSGGLSSTCLFPSPLQRRRGVAPGRPGPNPQPDCSGDVGYVHDALCVSDPEKEPKKSTSASPKGKALGRSQAALGGDYVPPGRFPVRVLVTLSIS